MKYFMIAVLLSFPVYAVPHTESGWQCESMDIHRYNHLHMRKSTVEYLSGCKPVCKSMGCPETARICWTDDMVKGETKKGQRYMECE